MPSMIIVLTTTSTQTDGEELAAKIVEARLAGCVQILPRMTSVYTWEGRVTKDDEHLMLIKTLPEKYDELAAFITAHHSYEVPEMVSIDAERVADPYFSWLNSVVNEKP